MRAYIWKFNIKIPIMKIFQKLYLSDIQKDEVVIDYPEFEPDLVLFFGNRSFLESTTIIRQWRENFPKTLISGCSTSGEIHKASVYDDSLSITAIQFEKTKIAYQVVNIDDFESSDEAGMTLIGSFDKQGLKHVLVFSDGLLVNGSELVRGIRWELPEGCNATGGLAGDGALFEKTVVVTNEGVARGKTISAIGFYGESLHVGYGSLGGWDSFGIERNVTKSSANVLYEIDNQPALDLYKSFLGDKAKDLPSSGLLFPLSMRLSSSEEPVVRTILAVDEKEKSLTFAGDIPEGAQVKLMKANIDRLIDGAEEAAKTSIVPFEGQKAQLSILISCVGRKLVLKQLVEEEVEAVESAVGNQSVITGFYSYGEIAPFLAGAKCELHNQTMTITTFTEN